MSASDILAILICCLLVAFLVYFFFIPRREITVIGEASMFETPNEAFLDVGVSKMNIDPKKAQEEGAMAMNNLIQAFNLAPEDIQTFDYTLQTMISDDNHPVATASPSRTYKFDQTVRLHIRNVSLVPHFLQVARSQADYIGNLQWEVDQATREKDNAEIQRQAILDAQHKAENLLRPLNATLGKPRSIQVDSNEGVNLFRAMPSFKPQESSSMVPTTEPGQIKLSTRVTVVFDIAPWHTVSK